MGRSLPLSVLIVDDHRLFRQGLAGLMSTRPDLVRLVGEASTAQEALSRAKALRPDLVLMDISMPGGSGLEAAKTLRDELPDTAVVFLTSSEDDEHLRQAARLGASGYLLKDLDAHELFELISGIVRGEAAMTKAMASRLLKVVSGAAAAEDERTLVDELTEREVEVLRYLASGVSNAEIATELYVTVNTVKTHIHNILAKLQVDNRTQAATFAVQRGLISLDE